MFHVSLFHTHKNKLDQNISGSYFFAHVKRSVHLHTRAELGHEHRPWRELNPCQKIVAAWFKLICSIVGMQSLKKQCNLC